MALDTRRYQQHRAATQTTTVISGSALPGLVIVGVGLVVIVIGIILIAAFGVPSDVSNHPEQLSGVIVLVVGIVITLVGIILAAHLKKQADLRRRQKRRQDQEEQQRRADHLQQHRQQQLAAASSGHQPGYYHQTQQQQHNNAYWSYNSENGGVAEQEAYTSQQDYHTPHQHNRHTSQHPHGQVSSRVSTIS